MGLGGSFIAISPQLSKYTQQVVKKNNLTFPVLVDADNGYAEKLGLTFPLPEKLKEVYKGFGIDLERFNGNNSWKLPMSGRFIIASDGIIRSTEVHPDHTIRPEPKEIVDLLKSIA
nr:redoxin domain-containing protein [Desulfosediminicola flagellatus]